MLMVTGETNQNSMGEGPRQRAGPKFQRVCMEGCLGGPHHPPGEGWACGAQVQLAATPLQPVVPASCQRVPLTTSAPGLGFCS